MKYVLSSRSRSSASCLIILGKCKYSHWWTGIRHVLTRANTPTRFEALQELAAGVPLIVETHLDRQKGSTFPLTSAEMLISLADVSEGPHIARISVARAGDGGGANAALDRALAALADEVLFFLRVPREGGEGGEGDEGGASEAWLRSLMSLLVQHPPANHTFAAGDELFVQVRVADAEMALPLDAAAALMQRRGTVFQRRPFVLHAAVDGAVIGDFWRATRLALPELPPGPHRLDLLLLDVAGTRVATAALSFHVAPLGALPPAPPAAADAGGRADALECAWGAGGAGGVGEGSCEWAERPAWPCAAAPEAELCEAGAEGACSGHGRCVAAGAGGGAGQCVCGGGWEGAQCSHSILDSREFLPTLDPRRHPCVAAARFSAGAAALAAALRARQFPPTCADEAAFVVRVPLQGIGIMAQFLAAGAAEALISQRTMLLHEDDFPWLRRVGGCVGAGAPLGCYFHAITNCSAAATRAEHLQAKALVRGHIARAGLAIDADGSNSNVGLLLPSAVPKP